MTATDLLISLRSNLNWWDLLLLGLVVYFVAAKLKDWGRR